MGGQVMRVSKPHGTLSSQIDGGLGFLSWQFHQVSNKIESKWRLIQAKGATRQFTCPVCLFEGRFVTDRTPFAQRYAALCPRCQSAERHRLQFLSMQEMRKSNDFTKLSLLHIAPEKALGPLFRSWFGTYTTADINPDGVDLVVDLTEADLPDQSFDVVYASHVLEEIPADHAALKEIARILKPGGFAVLRDMTTTNGTWRTFLESQHSHQRTSTSDTNRTCMRIGVGIRQRPDRIGSRREGRGTET
jgi:hypothetical protein